ncbi:MAG: hypothetical protein IKZ21_07980 [Clostridia bacterium]|nr:hypothetical protein [Clostridia bacterium]
MKNTETVAQTPLLAGFARADITPEPGMPLGGYGAYESRRFKDVRDPIAFTCVALTQGEETVLLYTIDNCGCGNTLSEEFCEVLTPELGIPYDHVFFGATHSHSCPVIRYADPECEAYRDWLPKVACQLAKEALADQAPAQVYQGKKDQPDAAFVRHYVTGDGVYMGSNFNEHLDKSLIVGYAAEKLSELGVAKFEREGKPAILLVNFHIHPDHAAANGFRSVSADVPGALRNKLEADTGALVAYFTGAAGNQTPSSWIPADHPGLTMQRTGDRLAQRVEDMLPYLEKTEGKALKCCKRDIYVDFDHTWDDRLEDANRISEIWEKENRNKATEVAMTLGFTSAFHARSVIAKATYPVHTDLTLGAVSVAGMAIVNTPFEMFGVTGADIKARSPFGNTLIFNGCEGYIPDADAYRYRCYEVDLSAYAPGTAERVADTVVSMLNELA